MNDKVVVKSLFYKYSERLMYQGVSFLVQLIIARILAPSDYGMITILTVFISLSQVFVQSGLNTALIQDKNVKEEDYSYVFWISFLISFILYGVMFAAAPLIASFYELPELATILRALALILFPGAYNSIQIAKVSREFSFKKLMVCTFLAALLSGTLGIVLAIKGLGVWTLVYQQLSNQVFLCLFLTIAIKWKLRFAFSFARVKHLFRFGWKLLCSSLISTLCDELQSLATGKKYSSDTLGYYNRGKQFPQIIVENINEAIRGVMLPTLSKHQDDKAYTKNMLKKSIKTSSYIVFPMMAGLAAVATPLVELLLTDKWLFCVPYLQVQCFVYAFYPIHTTNLQAMNAQGRSDLFLKAEIIKRTIDTAVLFITIFCFDTPLAIVLGRALCQIIGCIVNSTLLKSIIGYGFIEQMKDILPSAGFSIVMVVAVCLVDLLKLPLFLELVLQIFIGVLTYLALSVIFKYEVFIKLKKMCCNLTQKDKE